MSNQFNIPSNETNAQNTNKISTLDNQVKQFLIPAEVKHQTNPNNLTKAQTIKCTNIKKQSQLLHIECAIYKPIIARLCSFHLHVKDEIINLQQIDKIKIYPNKISTKFYQFKINVNQKEHYFAASYQSAVTLTTYPEHFQWFRGIIQARLQSAGIKFNPAQNLKLAKSKLGIKIESIHIEGEILKKSKYLKKWDKRYVVISSSGFYSFKDSQDSNYSYFIKSGTITEIWTRFQLVENNQFLIIKLMYGQHEKIQFGIPLASLKQKQHNRNWLYQFYKIMQEAN